MSVATVVVYELRRLEFCWQARQGSWLCRSNNGAALLPWVCLQEWISIHSTRWYWVCHDTRECIARYTSRTRISFRGTLGDQMGKGEVHSSVFLIPLFFVIYRRAGVFFVMYSRVECISSGLLVVWNHNGGRQTVFCACGPQVCFPSAGGDCLSYNRIFPRARWTTICGTKRQILDSRFQSLSIFIQ